MAIHKIGNRAIADTKQEARDNGVMFYYGTPCKRGHTYSNGFSIRYMKTGICMTCNLHHTRVHEEKELMKTEEGAREIRIAKARHRISEIHNAMDNGEVKEVWDE